MPSISTTGTHSDPVTTAKNPGEANSVWLDRHRRAIESAGVSGKTTLTSTWGNDCTETSQRANSMSDAEFVSAHMAAVINAMFDCPP